MPTALITGATAGIGEACVHAFADAGWNVVATGRREDRLEKLARDNVRTLAFDIRDEAARDAALDGLPQGFRDIDLLVNNAGLALGLEPAQQASLANWKTMIDTNVTALASITHKLLPMLIARKGAIINLSSVAATYPGMVETEFTLVRTGSQDVSDKLYAGVDPMTGEDIAETILWVATLPPHLNINTLELMPVNQSWQGFAVHREP